MSAEERWAIVEIMGHRVVCGRVTEITQFGVPMCRVEVPTIDGEGFQLAQDYGGASIFCITNTTKAECVKRAPRPYTAPTFQLGAGDEEEDDVENCEACNKRIGGDDIKRDVEGVPLCKECWLAEPKVKRCITCDQTFEVTDIKLDVHNDPWCPECWAKYSPAPAAATDGEATGA
jgi:hypothetical protein